MMITPNLTCRNWCPARRSGRQLFPSSNSTNCRHPLHRITRDAGFTLVELLIVILIVVTLAVLVFTTTQKVKLNAAKVNGVRQMRNIGVAAAVCAADNSRTEPFYHSNGTVDNPNECLQSFFGNSKITPGNPGMALYNTADPDSGYVQNPADFFSPLVKATIPTRVNYNPKNASNTNPWGTYAWYYPFVSKADSGLYPSIDGKMNFPAKVNPNASGRLMMCENYDSAFNFTPRFGKTIYNALMSDGSVRQVAESDDAFTKWKNGD